MNAEGAGVRGVVPPQAAQPLRPSSSGGCPT